MEQALAWLVGSALWIAYTFIMWLVRRGATEPQPVAEIPGDISPRPLTRPLILFAAIRAAALASAVAISFGLHLPNAYWMPIATIIAMKPDLQQSALIAEQRIAGTVVGAAVAALVLLTVDNRTALEVIVVVLVALGASIHGVNYAWYTAALAGAILIAADVPTRPTLPTRDAGSCSRSPAWGSPSSSCSWRTGCKSTPPKRQHRHLLSRPGRRERPGRRRPGARYATPARQVCQYDQDVKTKARTSGLFPCWDVRPCRWPERSRRVADSHQRSRSDYAARAQPGTAA